ncbi:MAG: ATP-binding protein [Myxococcota bacterium]
MASTSPRIRLRRLLPPTLVADASWAGVRAYRTAGLLVLGIVLTLLPIGAGLFTGDTTLVARHTALLFALLAGMVALRIGWLTLAQLLALVPILLINTVGIWQNGMVGNPAPLLAAIVPLVALALSGPRMAAAFALVVITELIGFGVAQGAGWQPPSSYPPDEQPIHMMVGGVLFVLLSLGLTFVLERGRSRAVRQLQDANEALMASRDAAEEQARARAALLSSMSHEIRTPLHGVLGTVELVLDGPLEARQRSLLEHADGAAHTLLRLLDEVLDFAKLEAGRIELEALPINLPALLDDISHLFAAKAERKGVALVVRREPLAPARVLGDETRLRQIVTNLVSNAIKFTEDGTVTLSLQRHRSGICIVVEDTGVGMTEEQAARIFSPFEQAQASTARRYGGTGLGLSICHELITLMGGTVNVRAAPGEGSAFIVTLPLPPARTHEVAPAGSEAVLLPGARILLAEDNALNALIVTQILERAGCTVIVARSGREAIAQLPQVHVDLVLMDMHMPEVDGPTATARLRSQGYTLPILGLTASVTPDERRQCITAGMDHVLTKPIRKAALLIAIREHLKAETSPPSGYAAVH